MQVLIAPREASYVGLQYALRSERVTTRDLERLQTAAVQAFKLHEVPMLRSILANQGRQPCLLRTCFNFWIVIAESSGKCIGSKGP